MSWNNLSTFLISDSVFSIIVKCFGERKERHHYLTLYYRCPLSPILPTQAMTLNPCFLQKGFCACLLSFSCWVMSVWLWWVRSGSDGDCVGCGHCQRSFFGLLYISTYIYESICVLQAAHMLLRSHWQFTCVCWFEIVQSDLWVSW